MRTSTPNIFLTYVLTLLISLICGISEIYGQRAIADGKITYIAENSCYTDIGKDKGASKGDTLFTKDRGHALLIIQSISRKSSYCSVINTSSRIRLGEELIAYVDEPSLTSKPVLTTRDTLRKAPTDLKALWAGTILQVSVDNDSSERSARTTRPVNRPPNQLSGRIALQSFFSRDMKNSDYNYAQPGGVINLDLNRIQGSHYNMSSNIRFRKMFSSTPSRSTDYPIRVYELSIEYNNPAVPYRYSAGRIFAPVINGVGNFDGVFFGYKLTHEWELGTFGGTQPNNLNSKPDMTNSKVGIYANFKRVFAPAWRWNTTLAFSGQYVNRKIDREYIYVQNDISLGKKINFYQNSEIGINRSDLSNRKNKIEISNLYIMGHYTPLQAVSLTASYDARVNVYLIQTYRSIPDSLFDDALLQGFRGDINWRTTRNLTLSASSSIRARAGDTHKTYLNSAGLNYYNLLRSQINVNYRYFLTSAQYTKANSSSLGLSRQFSNLYLSTTFRTYYYKFIYQHSQYRRNSITLDGSLALTRKLYSSFEYEYSTSKVEKADRFFIELSYRF